MANLAKKVDEEHDPIVVYSFVGSVIIPTEQGSFFASAVGGVIESRPTGNPFVLYGLKYIWDMSGQVSEFPEPIRIRLNTAQAVTEVFDFKFPAPEPEVPADVLATEDTPLAEDEFAEGGADELGEFTEEGEGDPDDLAEASVESESAEGPDEISW